MSQVIFKDCPLFQETATKHFQNANIQRAFQAFVDAKTANPLAPFGGKDFPFKGDGPLKGYPHAALANDIRIIYTISGRDPHLIKLYWIGTHDESGTGQPANIKRQKQLASRLARQEFV